MQKCVLPILQRIGLTDSRSTVVVGFCCEVISCDLARRGVRHGEDGLRLPWEAARDEWE